MRVSKFPLSTLKETPADAEVISHQLMLRAGMIRKLATGLYTWMPLGLKVLRRVENIVREEMDRAGGIELLMPTVQPAELWQESKRWEKYGPELMRLNDRHGRELCYGPTHEEVISDLARREIHSYKELPINYYQIQSKFRDEIRPRFGVMRSREFLMKDAYSFHMDDACLQDTYDTMYETYNRIFTRIGLEFRPVAADTGSIGGNASHEFHVLAESGEDDIAFSSDSDYAANVELAEALAPSGERAAASAEMQLADTPNAKTIDELVEQHSIAIENTVKTLIVEAAEDVDAKFIALLVRGDHELNEIKAEKLPQVAEPLRFATEEEIREIVGAGPGSLGPINLPIPCIIDRTVEKTANFSAGANIDGKHYFNINWERDLPTPEVADLRNVLAGDPSPDGQGTLSIVRGIEVGHIFQLGKTYSDAMNIGVLDENGKHTVLTMGCYGIGVTRVVAAAIEQNNDKYGIIWPDSIAPFTVSLTPINMHKSQRLREAVEALYEEMQNAGIRVLFDDRKARPGIMFADHELIGIPHRITFSEKGLDNGELEYKNRRQGGDAEAVPLDQVIEFLKGKIQ